MSPSDNRPPARFPRRMSADRRRPVDRLLVLFGDQLSVRYPEAFGLDPDRDAVLLVEAREESVHVPSHRQRTVLFLSAMRHFALELRGAGRRVHYVRLDDPASSGGLEGEIERSARELGADRLLFVRPGEWRVLRMVESLRSRLSASVEVAEDGHFLWTPQQFSEWAEGRRTLVMEHFYRRTRRELGVLVTPDGKPEGGEWNYDRENRRPVGPDTPARRPPLRFPADHLTREVTRLVARHLPDAPGESDEFAWPVTRAEALEALADFVRHRLPDFGTWQDAMLADEPWLFHSLLSPALNLKLLDPRECVDAAVAAYRAGRAPLNSVEGFVRQVIGWREFIRGVYWHEGPSYGDRNALGESGRLPELYWTGETEMACLRASLGQVLRLGYGHHIQRLMVTGNFALLAGVHPREISDWYLAMYVDAVDQVTLPNTLGMVMHADGGVVGTKPYAASGRYIDRMSDYCGRCGYRPDRRSGEDACPFNVLYWEFLARHRDRLRRNPRMAMALRNLDRLSPPERAEISRRSEELRSRWGVRGPRD